MVLLSPSEFHALQEVIILDVRTPQEFSQGHIEDAQLMNCYDDSLIDKINALDKKKSYAMYCHSGARSAHVAKIMHSQGFKNLYDLDGGILSWVDEDLPLV